MNNKKTSLIAIVALMARAFRFFRPGHGQHR